MSQAISTPEASREEKPGRSTERRALVAEDDLGIRSLVSAILRREGFVVDAVVNGRDALTLLCERTYALILLDLTMPEMNGVELLAYLRHRDVRLLQRVVVMTAAVQRSRPDLPAEVCHVLTKPFNLPDFHAVIRGCLADDEV